MKRDISDSRHTPPFTVPEGYWDTLTNRVMQRVAGTRTPRHRIPAPLRPYIGIAALFLAVLGVMRLLIPADTSKSDALLSSGTDPWNEPLAEEEVFDSSFNPTPEEIIEYLSDVADPYELLIAESIRP